MDMFTSSSEMFYKDKDVNEENTINIFEITLSNLMANSTGFIDEQDFMDRAKLLCAMGQTVMISNFKEYYRLVEYFSNYTSKKIRLSMGVSNLIEIFDEKYYRNLSGGILEAFGKLFFKNMLIYLYPMIDEKTGEIVNSTNLRVSAQVKELYKFFAYNKKVVDISNYNKDYLNIYSKEVLLLISEGKKGWEKMLPKKATELIKEKQLFGYQG